MLLQFLSCLYSFLPICLPLLHALFSCFTASLPNLTVRLLIRRCVSQAVLSFCLNIHLLSVYLHLRKKPPRAALLCPPPPLAVSLRSVQLPGLRVPRSIFTFFLLAEKNIRPRLVEAFLSERQMAFENVSRPVAYCKLAASILNCLFHTFFTSLQTHRAKQRGVAEVS